MELCFLVLWPCDVLQAFKLAWQRPHAECPTRKFRYDHPRPLCRVNSFELQLLVETSPLAPKPMKEENRRKEVTRISSEGVTPLATSRSFEMGQRFNCCLRLDPDGTGTVAQA